MEQSIKFIKANFCLLFLTLSTSIANAAPLKEMMSTSGFKVEVGDHGGLIFLPNENNAYDITARFDGSTVKGGDCEFMEHPAGRYSSFTLCRIEDWKAPIGFIEDLSSGDMNLDNIIREVNEFDWNKSQSSQLRTTPVVGVTYHNDFNHRIHEAEAKVWAICWDASSDGSYSPTIKTETSKRTDCLKVRGDRDLLLSESAKLIAIANNEIAKERVKRAEERLKKALKQ